MDVTDVPVLIDDDKQGIQDAEEGKGPICEKKGSLGGY
jgi:hypothetical protein